jgi:hypothetical protein
MSGVLGLYFINNTLLSTPTNIIERFNAYYLNDMLAPILFLAYINIALYIRSFKDIMTVTLLAGLFWEYVSPLFKANSVSDPLDICAYMMGGIIFYIIEGGGNKWKKLQLG